MPGFINEETRILDFLLFFLAININFDIILLFRVGAVQKHLHILHRGVQEPCSLDARELSMVYVLAGIGSSRADIVLFLICL